MKDSIKVVSHRTGTICVLLIMCVCLPINRSIRVWVGRGLPFQGTHLQQLELSQRQVRCEQSLYHPILQEKYTMYSQGRMCREGRPKVLGQNKESWKESIASLICVPFLCRAMIIRYVLLWRAAGMASMSRKVGSDSRHRFKALDCFLFTCLTFTVTILMSSTRRVARIIYGNTKITKWKQYKLAFLRPFQEILSREKGT